MTAQNHTSDEKRLIELLKQHRDQSGDTAVLDREIVALIYEHLHEQLRPVFLAQYGPLVGEGSVATRFTALLNQFFVNVLQKFPDGLSRVQTRRELSNYVSKALHRRIIDHFRHQATEDDHKQDLMDCLVRDLERNWNRDCEDVRFDAILQILERWENSDDQQKQMYAQLIRYEYLLGADYKRIADDLGIAVSTFYDRRQRAFRMLRNEVLQNEVLQNEVLQNEVLQNEVLQNEVLQNEVLQ